MSALGADVRRGDLDDLSSAAREADAVIHLAFKHDLMRSGDLAGALDAELHAIEAMGSALKGSGKPFVGTSATLPLGTPSTTWRSVGCGPPPKTP